MNISHEPVVFPVSIAPASGPVDVEAEFQRLWKIWRRASYSSDFDYVFSHPAYRSIIDLGSPAIPIILRQIRQKNGWWFGALEELTGVNPAAGIDSNEYDEVALAWMEWGSREGFFS